MIMVIIITTIVAFGDASNEADELTELHTGVFRNRMTQQKLSWKGFSSGLRPLFRILVEYMNTKTSHVLSCSKWFDRLCMQRFDSKFRRPARGW